jgi:hypothetical protein
MGISDINPPAQLATVQFMVGGGGQLQFPATCQATAQPGSATFSIDGGGSVPITPSPNPINFTIPDTACSISAADDPPHRLIITTIEIDGSINPSAPRCFFRGANPGGLPGPEAGLASAAARKGGRKASAKAAAPPVVDTKPCLQVVSRCRAGEVFPVKLDRLKPPPAGSYIRVGVFYLFLPDLCESATTAVLVQGALKDVGAVVHCPTVQPGHYDIHVFAWFATKAKPYPSNPATDLFTHCLRVHAV